MNTDVPRNGKTTLLLWANTILTALLLPLGGFVGMRLWDKLEKNAEALSRVQTEVAIVRERQDTVRDRIPKIELQLESLEKRVKP